MTVFAYYRVSTDKQDYESQKIGVVEYANRMGLTIDKEIVDDGVSGTVKACKRNLKKILVQMRHGDIVITSELSRLGRSTSDVLQTCEKFANRGVSCYLVKQGMALDRSPMGKMMTAIFSAFAEMLSARWQAEIRIAGGYNEAMARKNRQHYLTIMQDPVRREERRKQCREYQRRPEIRARRLERQRERRRLKK